jgi:[ribosomal protein S5]-alanine N-acetyltransferase
MMEVAMKFPNTLTSLDGPTASLRPPSLGDLDAVYGLIGDGVVVYNVFDPVTTRAQAEEWLRRGIDLEPCFGGNWLIIDNISEEIAGLAMYYGASPWTSRAGIAYCLAPKFRGRGLATGSVRVMMAYLLIDVGINRLEAEITPGNDLSVAVVNRLGFAFEGTMRERFWLGGRWKDALMYSFLKSDYPRSASSGN